MRMRACVSVRITRGLGWPGETAHNSGYGPQPRAWVQGGVGVRVYIYNRVLSQCGSHFGPL